MAFTKSSDSLPSRRVGREAPALFPLFCAEHWRRGNRGDVSCQGIVPARQLHAQGEFELTLVTQTPRGSFDDPSLPFPVVRQPNFNSLRKLIRSADVVHVAGAAISPILLGLVLRKPVVVEHHGFQTICPTGQLFQEPENIPCPGHFMAERYTTLPGLRAFPKPLRHFISGCLPSFGGSFASMSPRT